MENKNLVENNSVAGSYIIVDGRKHKGLVGRGLLVTKWSKTKGMVNGFLLNPKTGLPQGTEIAIPMECIEKVGLPALLPSPKKPTGQKVITPEVILLPGKVKKGKGAIKVG